MNVYLDNFSKKNVASWKEAIKHDQNNTIFQSLDFFFFYKDVKNYKPYIFTAEDVKGAYSGVLLALVIKESPGLRGYFSTRVLIFGGPIISNKIKNKLEVLDELLSKLVVTLKNKSIFIQFRNFFEWNEEEKHIFVKHGFTYRERQNIILKLSSQEDVLRNISESKRRQIRLAKKNGTIVRSPKNIEEVKTFYYILRDLYTKKIRKPLPDFSFFKEFFNRVQDGLGIIRLVLIKDKIIGGVIAPITPKRTIYYWYVAGLDHKYKNNYPSIMAVWSLMEYGIANNIERLDFMGIGKPDQIYGVREFKMRFSKNVIDYGRFERRNNKFLYNFAEFGFNILRSFKKV